jgi:hypothetical protein
MENSRNIGDIPSLIYLLLTICGFSISIVDESSGASAECNTVGSPWEILMTKPLSSPTSLAIGVPLPNRQVAADYAVITVDQAMGDAVQSLANPCCPEFRTRRSCFNRAYELLRVGVHWRGHLFFAGCAYIGLTRALAKKDNPDGP